MTIQTTGQYAKLLVAASGFIIILIQTIWPHAAWGVAVTSFVSALLVYLVPNSKAQQ
jgi:hypothetical protein